MHHKIKFCCSLRPNLVLGTSGFHVYHYCANDMFLIEPMDCFSIFFILYMGMGTLYDVQHCIPPPRLAPPGELSLRHTGRLTIRPCPPEEEAPTTFEVGAAVDAWWKNGWWEGFVITVESLSSSDSYHVFLPGTLSLHLSYHISYCKKYFIHIVKQKPVIIRCN